MSELSQPARRFRQVAREKLAEPELEAAIASSVERLRSHRLEAWGELQDV